MIECRWIDSNRWDLHRMGSGGLLAELTQQKPIIRITFDEMEAYMLLPEPEQGTGYTDSQIRQEMAARGITTGIDEQRISDMLEGHTYNAELLIAAGEEAGGWNGRLLRIQVRHEL